MKNGKVEACGSYSDIELMHPSITAKWTSILAMGKAKREYVTQRHAFYWKLKLKFILNL